MFLPHKLCLSLFAFFVFVYRATASFYTIIDYVALSPSVGGSGYTYTSSIHLNAPVTSPPTASATSTSSSSDTSRDITYLTKYYALDDFPQALLAEASSSSLDSDLTITLFYQEAIYTAPATCPSDFTFTTSQLVFVPFGAETNLNPTSATTETSGGDVTVTAFLTPSAVPSTGDSDLRTTSDFVQENYINSCSNPSAPYSYSRTRTGSSYRPTSTRLSGGDDDDYFDYYYRSNCLGSLCPEWLIYIVVIVPILVLLFLGGLLESFLWFSRLMQGKYALRGVPICWILISLWTLCCLRTHRAAQPGEQARLQKQWREMSAGTKFKLWTKYGFRHRDPAELGTMVTPGVFAPPGQNPQMMQNGQPIYFPPGQPPPPVGPGGMYYPQQPGQYQQPFYPQQPGLQPGQYNQPGQTTSMYSAVSPNSATHTSSMYSPALSPQQVPTPSMSPPPQNGVGMAQPYYPPPPGGPTGAGVDARRDLQQSPVSATSATHNAGPTPEQTHAQPVQAPTSPIQGQSAGQGFAAPVQREISRKEVPGSSGYHAYSPPSASGSVEGQNGHGPVEQVQHGPSKMG